MQPFFLVSLRPPGPVIQEPAEEVRPAVAMTDGAETFPAWKRGIDLIICMAGLPLLALVMIVAVAILGIYSPGAVLYRQVRVGHRGRKFTLYKIRTMTRAADTAAHKAHVAELMRSKQPMEKLDTRGDERLVPGGLFLRASGLDELPQLINVLRGEMSLVGPRPCLPFEFEHYPPDAMSRFQVRPGLTGLWQVSGKNHTSFDEMFRLDRDYVRDLSLRQDLRIIVRTLPVLVRQVAETRVRSRARARLRKMRSARALALHTPERANT